MIITEFGRFIYNYLSMVMFAAGDIFQPKVDELVGEI